MTTGLSALREQIKAAAKEQAVNASIFVEVSGAISLGFAKGERPTRKQLGEALRQNLQRLLDEWDFEDACDRVSLNDFEAG